MSKSIQISIPTPCHENWAAMTPTERGRFCTACQKQVINFTKATDREIAGVLGKNNNVCARVNPSQVNRDLVIPPHRKSSTAAIVAVAVLSGSPAVGYARHQSRLNNSYLHLKMR